MNNFQLMFRTVAIYFKGESLWKYFFIISYILVYFHTVYEFFYDTLFLSNFLIFKFSFFSTVYHFCISKSEKHLEHGWYSYLWYLMIHIYWFLFGIYIFYIHSTEILHCFDKRYFCWINVYLVLNENVI